MYPAGIRWNISDLIGFMYKKENIRKHFATWYVKIEATKLYLISALFVICLRHKQMLSVKFPQ